MYHVGRATPFRIALGCLNLFKCYPKNLKDSQSLKFRISGFIVSFLTFLLCFIGPCIHLVMMKIGQQDVETSEDLLVMFGSLGATVICAFFTRSRERWHDFLQCLIDFKPYTSSFEFEEEINRRNILGLFYAAYYLMGFIIYGITAYTDNSTCHRIKEEKNINLICGTYFPIWIPFDITSRAIHWVIFFVQCFLSTCTFFPASMICFLAWEATKVICIHINLSKEHFKYIIDNNCRTRPDGLAFWVEYHNHVLQLAETLRVLVKETVGSVALCSAVVLGCTEHSIMRTKPLGGIIFLLGWMAALLMVCNAGEILMDQTLSVGNAISESRWYKADKKTRKDIVFILLRTQKAIFLESSPLGVLNYALFILILRTSYSYMTLLNRTG